MLLSIPRMAPRWLYMVMLFFLLQLTQLPSQLSTKISATIKNSQISYIYTTKIANTCTERVTHFGDSLAVDTCTPGVHIFTDDIKYYNYHPIRLTSPFLPPQ